MPRKTTKTTVPENAEALPRRQSRTLRNSVRTASRSVPNPAYGISLLILLAVTALLLGMLAVLWRQSILNDARSQTDARVRQLMDQLKSDAFKPQATSTREEPAQSATTTNAERTIRALDEIACNYPFIQTRATTTVEYVNDQEGIRARLPFNPTWSPQDYALPSFDALDPADTPSRILVAFGPGLSQMQEEDRCILARLFSLQKTDQRPASSAIRELGVPPSLYANIGTPIRRVLPSIVYVKGFVRVREGGTGYRPIIEVFGKDRNYQLTTAIEYEKRNDAEQALTELERVAQSIRFTK